MFMMMTVDYNCNKPQTFNDEDDDDEGLGERRRGWIRKVGGKGDGWRKRSMAGRGYALVFRHIYVRYHLHKCTEAPPRLGWKPLLCSQVSLYSLKKIKQLSLLYIPHGNGQLKPICLPPYSIHSWRSVGELWAADDKLI